MDKRPYTREVKDKARIYERTDSEPPRLRKGDRVRFNTDYTTIVTRANGRRYMGGIDGPMRENVYAEAGEIGRVIWAKSSTIRGTGGAAQRHRIGVVFPGETEPVFINQRFHGNGMEKI